MATPIIYRNPSDVGISMTSGANDFGALGEIDWLTFHHSAGPRATSKARAMELHRAYQRQHIAQGFGDIGYHWSMDDHGRLYRLRPVSLKGAHVGRHNTGNVGLMIHGNYMHDKLTRAQKATIKWIFQGGLLVLTGERESGFTGVRGHREWPGHNTNLCPGTNLMAHLAWRRRRDL